MMMIDDSNGDVRDSNTEQSHRQNKDVFHGSRQRTEQDRDQQHEQHQHKNQHKRPEIRRGEQFQVLRIKCLRKLLRISYLEHKTNDRARSKVASLSAPRISSGNSQETETRMRLSKTIPPGTFHQMKHTLTTSNRLGCEKDAIVNRIFKQDLD